MIRLRLDVADVQRMRFAYPPITEIAEILYRLHDTITAHPLLGSWPAGTRRVLHPPDVDLLRALVPARGNIANFLGPGAADASTTPAAPEVPASPGLGGSARSGTTRCW
jgi:hypothetical protein